MNHAIIINDPADRLDLSYVFANNYAALGKHTNALVEMAEVGRNIVPGVHCRAILTHPVEAGEMARLVGGSGVRVETVIDFPDGLGGAETKRAQARITKEAGGIGGDLVVNLHAVATRDRAVVVGEIRAVAEHLGEVKVIAQIPYLWQYDRDAIPWLIDVVAEGGAYCIKDWTTRLDNFLLPDGEALDYSHETRMRYLEYMADYVQKNRLPLVLKVAGRVTPENVQSFVDAGAFLIGTSYRKAPALRDALLKQGASQVPRAF
ncbi:MAG: hypothetical protein HY472_00180 [Candidatus Sungbacteria bacterium]|nr:hypothetical protein [Candidatus Sungbacteria bacterium]